MDLSLLFCGRLGWRQTCPCMVVFSMRPSPAPLGQSPSLLMQPDWLELWVLLSFPVEMGSEVLFFPLSSYLEVLFVFFLVEIIFHTSDKSRWYLYLINHWVILKQDKDYPFRKLYPISNTQSQTVLTTLFCQVWWLVSIRLALGKLRQESLRLTWTA